MGYFLPVIHFNCIWPILLAETITYVLFITAVLAQPLSNAQNLMALILQQLVPVYRLKWSMPQRQGREKSPLTCLPGYPKC